MSTKSVLFYLSALFILIQPTVAYSQNCEYADAHNNLASLLENEGNYELL